jgi:hypothetical protein
LYSSTTTNVNDDIATLDQALKDNNLKEAIAYLKKNPSTSLSRDQWDAIFHAIEERTAHVEENSENLRVEFPLESAARQEMTDMYATLKNMQQLSLFGAANTSSLDLLPASGSHSLPPSLLESILNMPMASLTPEPTNTLLLAGGVVAVLEILTSLVTDISLNTLVVATLVFGTMDRIFLNGAVIESFLKIFSPGIQTKILKHEAGHFLVAYLLGCPVEGIVLSAWAALADRRFGTRQVSAGTSFFDPQLSQQINNKQASVTRASIDRYSIIVMAGIAAEALAYQRADGGAGDEMALIAFLSNLGMGRGAKTIWTGDIIRNQARWGALQAVLLLREYKPAYDALVDALERGGSLGDCIFAIEKAARENKLQPIQRPIGWIVKDTDGVPSWSTSSPWDATTAEETVVVGKPAPVTVTSSVAGGEPPRSEFDEEESIRELQRYKNEVEAKLRTIEEQLKGLDD